tara:strand:- start:883 stop:2472 length:1590 start_codon:yes stop_codon:yes gene_type:complete
MSNSPVTWIFALIVAAIIVIWLLNWLYLRGSSDKAYVRTGFGGRKITLDGGMFVLPILHEVFPVSLGLSKVALKAEQEGGLITADRMRIDVDAEFFLRVSPDADAVALAASTLGPLTNQSADLAGFYESEFLGALRGVAAEQSLSALHENRAGFVESVQARVAPVLARNGLELSSVAIRNLDQTALEHFNPANQFDAEGLTQLIGTVEERRQLRNAIEQKSAVAIREANLVAEKETLSIDRESQLARLEQEREIETKRAALSAEIAREQAERTAEAEAARITGAQSTNQREIAAKEEVERARYASERALDESRILREQELRRLEIEREKFIDLAKLQTAITILEKSVEEAEARVNAKERLIAAAKASETVSTAQELGAAERAAAVSKIDIARETGASEARSAVQAEAERLLNEAENVLTNDARAGRLKAQLIDKLESVIAETVKPIEKIEGIKMVHMTGSGAGEGTRSPTDEVIDSALRYRVQAPMIDELMKEIGVEGANISKMGDVMRAAKDAQSLAKETEKKESKDD